MKNTTFKEHNVLKESCLKELFSQNTVKFIKRVSKSETEVLSDPWNSNMLHIKIVYRSLEKIDSFSKFKLSSGNHHFNQLTILGGKIFNREQWSCCSRNYFNESD